MAIKSGHVNVTDVATRLDIFAPRTGVYGQSMEILVRNISNAQVVYAGGPGVTVAQGYQIGKGGGTLSLGVTPPDSVWGICTPGNSAVCEVIMTNVM